MQIEGGSFYREIESGPIGENGGIIGGAIGLLHRLDCRRFKRGVLLSIPALLLACELIAGSTEQRDLPLPHVDIYTATASQIVVTASELSPTTTEAFPTQTVEPLFLPSFTPTTVYEATQAAITDLSETQEVLPSSVTPPPIVRLQQSVDYGIHVLDPLQNALQAKELGVGIVKIQVRWADIADCGGADYSGIDSQVNAITSMGMRLLLSVVTAPSCSNAANSEHFPPDDLQLYANFVRDLASRYGGNLYGVELWNEENLDREWGVPDPARFTELLRLSYAAIKSVNPGAVVIMGAPAPTWHNPPAHWDDIAYMQAVANAGGGDYVDCIGAHVNALTFPPAAKSTEGVYSVNGNTHHSWYYYDTLWGYWNAYGGQKPICVTEFGVASPEAIGGLPPGFEWARQTDLNEQASWLVEGMNLAEQGGIVRALIIWNLDFSPECGGCVDEKSPYSILGGDFSALPAFQAIQTAMGR
jgi:polysaccharide biosynthesis protein PslG